jgi:hypothetical protein
MRAIEGRPVDMNWVMDAETGLMRDIDTEDGWYAIGDPNMPDTGYADLVDMLAGKPPAPVESDS